jgi:hypothetical protein
MQALEIGQMEKNDEDETPMEVADVEEETIDVKHGKGTAAAASKVKGAADAQDADVHLGETHQADPVIIDLEEESQETINVKNGKGKASAASRFKESNAIIVDVDMLTTSDDWPEFDNTGLIETPADTNRTDMDTDTSASKDMPSTPVPSFIMHNPTASGLSSSQLAPSQTALQQPAATKKTEVNIDMGASKDAPSTPVPSVVPQHSPTVSGSSSQPGPSRGRQTPLQRPSSAVKRRISDIKEDLMLDLPLSYCGPPKPKMPFKGKRRGV